MTKSADHEQASPSSSPPAYVFEGPALVAIRTRTNDQPKYVDTRLPIWTWYDGGLAMTIDWAELHLNPDIMQIAKAFVAYFMIFSNRGFTIDVETKYFVQTDDALDVLDGTHLASILRQRGTLLITHQASRRFGLPEFSGALRP